MDRNWTAFRFVVCAAGLSLLCAGQPPHPRQRPHAILTPLAAALPKHRTGARGSGRPYGAVTDKSDAARPRYIAR